MVALSEKNAHEPSEVVGQVLEMVGRPFKVLTSILYILIQQIRHTYGTVAINFLSQKRK